MSRTILEPPPPFYRAGIAQSLWRLATSWTVRSSNSGGGEIFRNRPHRPWGPPSLLYNGYRVFPGGKAAGAWRWPPTPTTVEVKERVELYLYSPSGPSWPVQGWTLPLSLPTVLFNQQRKVELRSKAAEVSNRPLTCKPTPHHTPSYRED